MSKLETNTIDTVSGTSTLQVGSTNTTTITLGASGDTINIPSGATINNNGTQTGFGGTNTPTFLVRKNGDQSSIPSNTYTKITGWTEIFDPQSTFASDKWSPASSGKYFIFGTAWIEHVNAQRTFLAIYKNGSLLNQSAILAGGGDNYPIQVTAMDTNDGDDYYALYVSQRGTGTTVYSSGVTNQFGGYKIIE